MNYSIKLCAMLTGLAVNLSALPCNPIPETEIFSEPTITASGVAYLLEDYVAGIVMAEVPYSFEPEALKAQAVAARTYCIYNLARGADSREEISCAFETKEGIAARFGKDYAESAYKIAIDAVNSTAGQILVTGGEPILAVWHASSRNTTESSVNVWGGERSYLTVVESPEDAASIKTEAEFSLREVKKLLEAAGYKYNMSDMLAMTQNSAGRCATLSIGNVTITGTKARTIFGLRSTDFTVKISDGKLIFKVYGYGHGVGMSQLGANTLAKKGLLYDEILAHYYPGSSLLTLREIYGTIFPNI
jgi:stage II sporulation protein D